MPPARKISPRQLEILISFAEENLDIALGRCSRGPQAHQISVKAWDALAMKLNAVANGVSKTGDQWRRYWIELKAKTKAKGADVRRSAAKTGGGPSHILPLTAIEERILQIVGRVAVEGLPGVQIPFQIPVTQSQASTSTAVEEPYMEVEWLNESDIQTPPCEQFLDSPTPVTAPIHTPSPPPPPPPVAPPEVLPSTTASPLPSLPQPLRRVRRRRNSLGDLPEWAREQENRRLAFEESVAGTLANLVNIMERVDQNLYNVNQNLSNINQNLSNISSSLCNKSTERP